MTNLAPKYIPQSDEAFILQKKLKGLGIELDIQTGHLCYAANFVPVNFSFELVFARHGETYGNCGQTTVDGKIDKQLVEQNIKNRNKRIYQGNVDSEINQLTALGRIQAEELAIKLEQTLLAQNWHPDIILHSPLSRAKDTGMPFILRNDLSAVYLACDGIKEIKFGSWENRRICDIEPHHPCHLFYLNNHALVKCHEFNDEAKRGEAFAELILRAHATLCELEKNYQRKKILLFSHSMFGAACRILFGQGQIAEDDNYLAFDGRRKDGQSYSIPHATPFLLNFIL